MGVAEDKEFRSVVFRAGHFPDRRRHEQGGLLWFVYELTGSAFKMAIIGLLQTIPPLVFGPLIGVYLDRMKKKPILIWVDLIRAGLVLLIPLLYAMGALTLERLYVLVFATSIVSTVFGPALASTVPLLAPRAQRTAAYALIQSTTNIGLLIGPVVSGVGDCYDRSSKCSLLRCGDVWCLLCASCRSVCRKRYV